MTLKTQWLGSFALKGHSFCTTEVRDEIFRSGKRYENESFPNLFEIARVCHPPAIASRNLVKVITFDLNSYKILFSFH